MSTLMEWIESIINNEDIFVVQTGKYFVILLLIIVPYSTKLWRSWNCKKIDGENFDGG